MLRVLEFGVRALETREGGLRSWDLGLGSSRLQV